ncbi:MAG TPA: enoyl-CoA hydratase-related protein [Candidatus Acidoferrales bacterium]
MAHHTLKLEYEAELAIITLARPEKRNAISTQMIEELLASLAEVQSSAARVAILTGEGKAFCSGMDLDELRAIATRSAVEHLEDSRRMARLFRTVYSFPKPLIAAVNGHALAGGCGLATLADFTLAVPEAKFGYTEVRIGFIPALVSVFLRRQIGEKRTRDLALTGRLFDAAEAHAMGLVNSVVAAEELMAEARKLAATLIAASPTSIARTKRLLVQFSEAELDREISMAIQENADIRATADFREGLGSFLEKRAPKWTGE